MGSIGITPVLQAGQKRVIRLEPPAKLDSGVSAYTPKHVAGQCATVIEPDSHSSICLELIDVVEFSPFEDLCTIKTVDVIALAVISTKALGVEKLSGKGSEPLAVSRILAVVCLTEDGQFSFLAPNDVASPAWVFRERGVPLAEVPIDCSLAFVDRRIVAVVNDRSGHPAEDQLYDVQALSTARERRQLDLRSGQSWIDVSCVDLVNSFEEGF